MSASSVFSRQRKRGPGTDLRRKKRKQQRPKQNNRYCGATTSTLTSIPDVSCEELAAFEAAPEKFFEQFVASRTPVVFRQAAQARELAAKWTPDYMKQHAGASIIEVERRGSRAEGFGLSAPKVSMSFGELIDLLYEKNDDMHYLTTQKIALAKDGGPTELCSAPVLHLRQDIALPHPLFPTLVPHQLNMWMGNNSNADGTSSGLHHDSHDNLYVVLEGHKDFLLMSPADVSLMYTTGKVSRVHRNGVINYEGFETREDGANEFSVFRQKKRRAEERQAELEAQLEDCQAKGGESAAELARALREVEAELDGLLDMQLERFPEQEESDEEEDEDDDEDEAAEDFLLPHFSLVGQYHKADRKKYPLLEQAAPIAVHLNPGDMLFLPASWFHDVTSRGRSCALNYWFYPPSTSDPANPYTDDFWSHRQREPLLRYHSASV